MAFIPRTRKIKLIDVIINNYTYYWRYLIPEPSDVRKRSPLVIMRPIQDQHNITEPPHGWCWKGPPEVIWSNRSLQGRRLHKFPGQPAPVVTRPHTNMEIAHSGYIGPDIKGPLLLPKGYSDLLGPQSQLWWKFLWPVRHIPNVRWELCICRAPISMETSEAFLL